MKKAVTLVLVLSMVSMAGAALQISVDGVQEPVDSQIEIMPNDTLCLDIWTDAIINPFQGGEWALVVDTNYGSIGGGVASVFPGTPAGANKVEGSTDDNAGVLPDAPLAGIWGLYANTGGGFPSVEAGFVLVDQIEFHCVAMGDAVIKLYAIESTVPFGDISGGTLMDSVTIHQIPEPATMALLGLGALLLRRKK